MAKAHIMNREDWAEKPDVWHGEFEGGQFGMAASVMFYTSDRIGGGPKLHQHPYDEIFIVREGRVRYTVGDEMIDAVAGQIVFAPANVPHKFENLGLGRLESTDIHITDHFATTWLED